MATAEELLGKLLSENFFFEKEGLIWAWMSGKHLRDVDPELEAQVRQWASERRLRDLNGRRIK